MTSSALNAQGSARNGSLDWSVLTAPFLFGSTTLLGAFLLFQLEPIIARLILPWFGGSAAVWTTCLLFFQLALLLGYLYANWLITSVSTKNRRTLHLFLLAASVAFLPIIPGSRWKPTGAENPTLLILGLLTACIGLPYFVLATTSPLLQAWYARSTRGKAPYYLYSLSNFASLLALVTYPVAVEPFLSRRTQSLMWSWTYAVFVLLCGGIAWLSGKETVVSVADTQAMTTEEETEESLVNVRPTGRRRLLWISLATCPSILLLAVTNFLSQDVAAIPFLWILPLSLYLLSFVLCFGKVRWYRRGIFLTLFPVAIAVMSYWQLAQVDWGGIRMTLVVFAAGFFVCCMVCHGELVRLKPALNYLTTFYLMIATGGAIGGVFVGLIAPYVFTGNFELPIGLTLCALLGLAVLFRDPDSRFHHGRPIHLWTLLSIGVLVLGGFQIKVIRERISGSRVMARNFYGRLWVGDVGDAGDADAYRKLKNGVINHGEQWLSPKRRREPMTYYCRYSGIGLTFEELDKQPSVKAGIIGLGTGTLAAYSRAGDTFRFYEINPLVIRLAHTQFTYLKDSPGRVDVVEGDARLSLEREPPQHFDLLVVDAFTSDSIPVHLMTREAVALYLRHLKPDGVLAFHVSNRYLDLAPIVSLAAASFHKKAMMIDTDDNDDLNCFGSMWVLISNRPGFFDNPDIQSAATPVESKAHLQMWTDDFSNLYQILK